jgi:hypothetical protein
LKDGTHPHFVSLAQEYIDAENLLLGFIRGFSFTDNLQCNAGLKLTINSFFSVLEYKNIQNPSAIIKFGLASNDLIDAYNTVTTYVKSLLY